MLVANAAGGFLVGLLLRRYLAVVAVGAAWVLFYSGLRAGLWGYGVGDAWWIPAGLFVSVGAMSAALGVVAGRTLKGRRDRSRRNGSHQRVRP